MGSCELLELRSAMFDEIEVVLKEFIEKYGQESRFVGRLGSGGMPSYFPDEWSRLWPVLRDLEWIVWEREQDAGEEDGPFYRTSGAIIGGPEESWVYGYVPGRIIEWMRRVVERWRRMQFEKVSVREEMMPVLYR